MNADHDIDGSNNMSDGFENKFSKNELAFLSLIHFTLNGFDKIS